MNSTFFLPDRLKQQLAKTTSNILVLGLFFSQIALAQTNLRTAGEPIRLSPENDHEFLQPRWSPSGDRLAVTGPNYEGLWIIDADTRQPRQLTTEKAAGFGFSWSDDGKALLTRVARYEGISRKNAVKIFDADTGQAEQLTEYRTRMPTVPQWTVDDSHVFLSGDKTFEILESGRVITAGKNAEDGPIFLAKENFVTKADLRTGELAPVSSPETGAILNIVTSPDGSMVTYEIMGGDLIVASTDGTNRENLGGGHRPRWSPDSRWIVYMVTEDDGHQFTGSDLFVARADGTNRTQLTTTSDALEMNPDWSPDGNFVAYDDQGAIYLLPVTEGAE